MLGEGAAKSRVQWSLDHTRLPPPPAVASLLVETNATTNYVSVWAGRLATDHWPDTAEAQQGRTAKTLSSHLPNWEQAKVLEWQLCVQVSQGEEREEARATETSRKEKRKQANLYSHSFLVC